jgi:hypothetical protein
MPMKILLRCSNKHLFLVNLFPKLYACLLMENFYMLTLTVAHKFHALGAEFTEFLPDSLTRIYGAIF